MKVLIKNRNTAKEGIIAIGQELIRRADDITKDLKDVDCITIYAQLNPAEIVNFDITKNYRANFEEKESAEEVIEKWYFYGKEIDIK